MNSLKVLKKNFSSSSQNSLGFPHLVNSIFNYSEYIKQKDRYYEEKWHRDNIHALKDIKEIQNEQRRIAEKDWTLHEDQAPHKSYLSRDLKFSSAKETIVFLNLIKNYCDEIDHHPEWTLQDKNLHIKLTSHFVNNNVSPKDYDLAAFISQKYEERNYNNFKYNSCNQTWLRNAAAVGISIATVFALVQFYNFIRHYRSTSRDFYFTKIVKN
jgi:pterin-4a-carbinolamine dehydratase